MPWLCIDCSANVPSTVPWTQHDSIQRLIVLQKFHEFVHLVERSWNMPYHSDRSFLKHAVSTGSFFKHAMTPFPWSIVLESSYIQFTSKAVGTTGLDDFSAKSIHSLTLYGQWISCIVVDRYYCWHRLLGKLLIRLSSCSSWAPDPARGKATTWPDGRCSSYDLL